MRPSQQFVSLLLLGTLAAAGACAEGSTSSATDFVEPKQTKEPTEPADESVTIPQDEGDSTDDDESSSSSNSGGSSGSSGTPDAGPKGSSGSNGTPDAGSCAKVPPSNVCGLAPQCGCASNQTCDVTDKTSGAVSCILAGGGPQGSLCTTSSQCAVGLTCAYGACRPHCATENSACTGTGLGICGQYYDPPGTAVPNAKVCTIACDLRDPSAACGSNTCIWDGSVKATDCDAAGTKALYDTCTKYNDCKPGLACAYNPLWGYECERWCRVGTNSDCGLLERCVDVYGADAPMQSGTKLGHCQ